MGETKSRKAKTILYAVHAVKRFLVMTCAALLAAMAYIVCAALRLDPIVSQISAAALCAIAFVGGTIANKHLDIVSVGLTYRLFESVVGTAEVVNDATASMSTSLSLSSHDPHHNLSTSTH